MRRKGVDLGNVDVVLAAGADEPVVDLGKHQRRHLDLLTLVPQRGAEAAIAALVGRRDFHERDVGGLVERPVLDEERLHVVVAAPFGDHLPHHG